jgi:hypothetical protein
MFAFGCGTCLARVWGMLIRRCAWHRSYHGYPFAFGIASWRGFRVSFTDGMCPGCAVRFRREWKLPEVKLRRAAFGWSNGLARAAMVVFVAASVIPAAHRLNDARPRGTVTAPSATVLVSSAPVQEESMPALAAPNRPGRIRTNPSRVVRAQAPRRTQFARAAIAKPSGSIPSASPAAVSVADSVVSATPAVIPSVRVAFAALPHAGLMQQAP